MRKNKMAGFMAGMLAAALWMTGCSGNGGTETKPAAAGDHANNDMAGDDEDSWKSVLNKEGYETECVLEGLGQIPAIRELYVQHSKAAMDSLAR